MFLFTKQIYNVKGIRTHPHVRVFLGETENHAPREPTVEFRETTPPGCGNWYSTRR